MTKIGTIRDEFLWPHANRKKRERRDMNKYRKKPIVVEAFQMTKGRRLDTSEWPDWLDHAWSKPLTETGALFCAPDGCLESETHTPLFIQTPEGTHEITWDDWIIQGVKGEIYPCKPDIFEATFEREDRLGLE